MKLKGVDLKRREDVVVFPRDTGAIALKIQAVCNYDEFDAVVERPQPGVTVNVKTGARVANTDHPEYQKKLEAYANMRTAWVILKALEINEDLIWETVDLAVPDTWPNWEAEFEAAGFSEGEKAHLLTSVLDVNGFNSDTLAKARNDFLSSLPVRAGQE